ALTLATKNFPDLDKTIYQKIYVSVLERLIYILIQKKNYRRAFIYANEKRLYIDINNSDEVNRWYLENSYIYEALGEKHKALSNLLTILSNNPADNLKVIILGNITKLYIDDGDMKNALNYLEMTMVLSNTLNDKASQTYCDYLNAKILIFEKKYKFAVKLFKDIFKNLRDLNDEQINYLNEFCELLLITEDYHSVKKYSDQYQKAVEVSADQYLKKNFYKNYLKASIMLLPGYKDEIIKLLAYTDLVEKEIIRNNEESILEANEDDKQLELNEKLQETIAIIENTINLVNLAMVKVGERESLLAFSKSLEKIVPFNEALFIIFNRANFELLPDLHDSFSTVATFSYKKDRLYERQLPYSSLDGTIIELLVTGNKDVILDFNDTNIPIVEPITKATYLDLKVKWLYATPLNYDGDLYACVVYTSTITDITAPAALLNLKIASKLLESKLINLFYQENLHAQKDILETAMSGLQEGLFYYETARQRMLLNPELASFLGLEEITIARGDYLKKIIDIDKHIHNQIIAQIEAKKPYKFSYNLSLEGRRVLVTEHGKPYFSQDGLLKFYICSIVREDLKNNPQSLDLKASPKQQQTNVYFTKTELIDRMTLEQKLINEPNYHLTIIGIKLSSPIFLNGNLLDDVVKMISSITNEEVYFLDKTKLVIPSKNYDSRVIDRWLREIRSELYAKESTYNINLDPFVLAIKYPKDFTIFADIIDIISFMLKYKYPCLDDLTYKEYLSFKTLNNCIVAEIVKNDLEILYSPLYMQTAKVGYEIKANIGGISPKKDFRQFISTANIVAFDKLIFDKIWQNNDSLVKFMRINVNTLRELIKTKYFDAKDFSVKPYLLVEGNSYDLLANLKYLKQLDYRIYLDYQALKGLTIAALYNLDIAGLLINSDLNEDERSQVISLSLNQKWQLITKQIWEDYLNSLYPTNELISEKELEKDDN
ncbi:MAG TPA: hypothetical protein VJZ51_04880, partial [Bacilli bacterium]|nr:hypothetical protein [Bacilli bacterium]